MKGADFNKEILNKRILPNENIVSWRVIDNQIIFFHKKERSFYELNKTGSFIWKKLNDKAQTKNIVDLISSNYDVDRDTAEKDTLEFIKDLLKKKIFIAR